jgi:hypothetical protein
MHIVLKTILILTLVFLSIISVGCADNQAATGSDPDSEQTIDNSEISNDDNIQDIEGEAVVICGLPAGEITLTLNEIKEMIPESGEAMSISSSGEETVTSYMGVDLGKIMEMYDVTSADYSALRLLATDGYSIEVPREILEASRVILAYELDGEPLRAKDLPLRVVIPDVRSMYWVRQLSRIELIGNEGKTSINNIYFFEEMLSEMTVSDDMNVDVAELLGLEEETRITMVASDGLIKTETLVIDDYKYLIQFDGEDSPLFHSPELPRTMYVKKLAVIMHANRAILFAGAFEEAEIPGQVFFDILSEYLSEGEIVLNPGLAEEQTIDKEALSKITIIRTPEGVNMN